MKKQCCVVAHGVSSTFGQLADFKCPHEAITEHDGKWYCKIHDPLATEKFWAEHDRRKNQDRIHPDMASARALFNEARLHGLPEFLHIPRDSITSGGAISHGAYKVHGGCEVIAIGKNATASIPPIDYRYAMLEVLREKLPNSRFWVTPLP